MKEFEILEEGRNDKVLVKWNRETRTEYSVHTWDLDRIGLIWGHYYNDLEDAKEYFEKTQNR